MSSIAEVIRQFKEGWTKQFEDEAILAACRQAQVKWRERWLSPVYLVKLFLLQILAGNTACDNVPRLAGDTFSGEAYCKARARLPLAILQALLTTCTSAMIEAVRDDGLWQGHRLWLVDGTGFSMPDTPALRAHFGSLAGRRPAVVFLSRIAWRWCMRGVVWCNACSSRRCGRTTCRWRINCSNTSRQAT